MDDGVLTPREAAESAAKNARAIYEAEGDGHVQPMLILLGEGGESVFQIHMSENIPAAMGRTLYAVAAVLKPHTVITVAETWLKRYTESAAPMKDGKPDLERGQLQRMREGGDMTVLTSLCTIAWRLDDTETVSIHDTVITEEPLAFEREVFEGGQEGNFYDHVMDGWRRGMEVMPPENLSHETIFTLLGLIGDVVGGILALPIDKTESEEEVADEEPGN